MSETKTVCPNCGYCPHCGRSSSPYRFYQWPPYTPYWYTNIAQGGYVPTVTTGQFQTNGYYGTTAAQDPNIQITYTTARQ